VVITRRHLQLGLAVFWIFDAALQFQPYMLSHRFSAAVIGPSASGQPGFVSAAVSQVAHLIGDAPVPTDVVFALAQLAIGLGLLWRRSARWALVGSIVWPLGIWYLGEGLGGVMSGHASLLTGAPGAALLYAIVAMAAWVGPLPARHEEPASQYVLVGWAVVWGIGALLQALPGQANAPALAASLSGAGQGDPGWLAGADRAVAGWIGGGGGVVVSLLIAAEMVIALAPFLGGWMARVAALAGGGFALLLWALGQGFGQIYTGTATDPNSGPLLILMATAVYSWSANGLGTTWSGPGSWSRTRAGRPALSR